MEKIFSPSIDSILSEASLDDRIDDGIVNLKNSEHVLVVVEKMYHADVCLELLEEFVKKHIATEGKFPERQAYNKEGWLVTFPSSDYKNIALKKGTHFSSDPTHGKGGMNVYYKRKGKQKRASNQEPSRSEPDQSPQQKTTTPAGDKNPLPQNPATKKPIDPTATKPSAADTPGSVANATVAGAEPHNADKDVGDTSLSPSDATSVTSPKSAPAPTNNVSTPTPPIDTTSHVNISIEFAKNKQWNPTPYGEWRNITGDTTAVVSLGGEVVPIKTTDREELKLFVAKKQP